MASGVSSNSRRSINDSSTESGCRTCIYVFENERSVIVEGIFISGQRTKISGHTNESVIYSLNRAETGRKNAIELVP